MRLVDDLEYVSVAETKAKLSEKIKRAVDSDRAFAITSHGKPKAVLISYMRYLSLSEGSDLSPQREIDLKEWAKNRKNCERVSDSITALFDERGLTKKGQKGYKKNAVKGMDKAKENA